MAMGPRSEEGGSRLYLTEYRGVHEPLLSPPAVLEAQIDRLTRYCFYLQRQWENAERPARLAEWEDAPRDRDGEATR
jgi:hypothetical protein